MHTELIRSFFTGKVRAFPHRFRYPLVIQNKILCDLYHIFWSNCATINSASSSEISFRYKFSPSYHFRTSACLIWSARGPFDFFLQPRYQRLIFIIISYICYLGICLFSDLLIWCVNNVMSGLFERENLHSVLDKIENQRFRPGWRIVLQLFLPITVIFFWPSQFI